jgi:hypothetical protein
MPLSAAKPARSACIISHVAVQQFVAARGGQISHVAGNDVARVWPSGILVRVVIGPHAVVDSPPGKHLAAHVIIEEGRINLLGEIFTSATGSSAPFPHGDGV